MSFFLSHKDTYKNATTAKARASEAARTSNAVFNSGVKEIIKDQGWCEFSG